MHHFTDTELFEIKNEINSSLPVRNMTRVFVFDDGQRIGLVESKWSPHPYDLPGGGCDEGETFDECAIRECAEEMGVEVTNLSSVAVSDRSDMGQCQNFHIVFFTARATEKGTPTSTDPREQGRNIIWLTPPEVVALMNTQIAEAQNVDYERPLRAIVHILTGVLGLA